MNSLTGRMIWLWSLLPVTNLLLSAFNYKHDYGWQKRRDYYNDKCSGNDCVTSEDGTLSDVSIISLQILVVILQATLAINFHRSMQRTVSTVGGSITVHLVSSLTGLNDW